MFNTFTAAAALFFTLNPQLLFTPQRDYLLCMNYLHTCGFKRFYYWVVYYHDGISAFGLEYKYNVMGMLNSMV